MIDGPIRACYHPKKIIFLKLNFLAEPVILLIEDIGDNAALALLNMYPHHLAWINQPETFQHAGDTKGLIVELTDGSCGWMVFRKQIFYLSYIVLHTEQIAPVEIGYMLLANIHKKHLILDICTENLPTDDPHLPAFCKLGYIEVPRREEMYRDV